MTATKDKRLLYLVGCPAVRELLAQDGLNVSNGENEVSLTEHSQSRNHPATQPLEARIKAVKVQKRNVFLLGWVEQGPHQAMHVFLILLLKAAGVCVSWYVGIQE